MNVTPETVIDFWFGKALDNPESARQQSKVWYGADADLDGAIRTQFSALLDAVLAGDYAGWESSAEGSLAMVILLDQFSRNIYRGDARAFSGDKRALQIAQQAVERGFDQQLPGLYRVFLYHPFHHSEQLADQESAVELMQTVAQQSSLEWQDFLHGFTRYAVEHREVVKRFGRFPHRNKILGRRTTAEEQAFLDDGASSYGQ